MSLASSAGMIPQYLYLCTSNASKLSTCVRFEPVDVLGQQRRYDAASLLVKHTHHLEESDYIRSSRT
jgi:hypothetical protein